MGGSRRGGLLLRVAGELYFVSAGDAVQIAPVPVITRVPGAPDDLLGIALEHDEILPIIAIGEGREAMVVCSYMGENLGIVGGEVVASGMFDVDAQDAVLYGGQAARPLDLAGIYARVHGGGWGGRWAG